MATASVPAPCQGPTIPRETEVVSAIAVLPMPRSSMRRRPASLSAAPVISLQHAACAILIIACHFAIARNGTDAYSPGVSIPPLQRRILTDLSVQQEASGLAPPSARAVQLRETALCSDRTPGLVYLREWPDDVARGRWLVFFEGGGMCTTPGMCEERRVIDPKLFTSAGAGYPAVIPDARGEDVPYGSRATNVLSPYARHNPAFHDWNHAFVPYCSQDLFSGQGDEVMDGRYVFGGASMAVTALDVVLSRATYAADGALAPSSPVRRVVLGGSSAGSIGAQLHSRFARDTYPAVPLALLLDSGLFLDYQRSLSGIPGGYTVLRHTSRWASVCQTDERNRTLTPLGSDGVEATIVAAAPCCLVSSCMLQRWVPRDVPVMHLANRFDVFELGAIFATSPDVEILAQRLLGSGTKGVEDAPIGPAAALAGYGDIRRAVLAGFAEAMPSQASYIIPACLQHEMLSPWNHADGDIRVTFKSMTYVNSGSSSNAWTRLLVGPVGDRVSVADAVTQWVDPDGANAGSTLVRLEDSCTFVSCNEQCPETVEVTTAEAFIELGDGVKLAIRVAVTVFVLLWPVTMAAVIVWVALFRRFHDRWVSQEIARSSGGGGDKEADRDLQLGSSHVSLDDELSESTSSTHAILRGSGAVADGSDGAAPRHRASRSVIGRAHAGGRRRHRSRGRSSHSSLGDVPPITIMCKDVRCVVPNDRALSGDGGGGGVVGGPASGSGGGRALDKMTAAVTEGGGSTDDTSDITSEDDPDDVGLVSAGDPPVDRVLVNGVSFFVNPGEVLAIMGASGSGKSSLLRAIADRLPPNALRYGEVWANGVELRDPAYAITVAPRVVFVQQGHGGFVDELSVRLNLVFIAHLTMPGATWAQREQRVSDVMGVLGLTRCADTVVGNDLSASGISGGQRRLLAVAVALLQQPSVLVLDEVSSGLDSDSTKSLMTILRDLAVDTGVAVVLTVHQPSAEVFALFHRVLVLVPGGDVAYFGSTANDDVADFLERALRGFLWMVDDGMETSDNIADFLIDTATELPEVLLEYYRKKVAPGVADDLADAIARCVGGGAAAHMRRKVAASHKHKHWDAGAKHTGRVLQENDEDLLGQDDDAARPESNPVKGKPHISHTQTRHHMLHGGGLHKRRSFGNGAKSKLAAASAASAMQVGSRDPESRWSHGKSAASVGSGSVATGASGRTRGGSATQSYVLRCTRLRSLCRPVQSRFVMIAVLEGRMALHQTWWDRWSVFGSSLFGVFIYGTLMWRAVKPVSVAAVFFTTLAAVPQAHIGFIVADVFGRVEQLRSDLNNNAVTLGAFLHHGLLRSVCSSLVTYWVCCGWCFAAVLPWAAITVERTFGTLAAGSVYLVFCSMLYNGIVLFTRTRLLAELNSTGVLMALSVFAGFMFPNVDSTPLYLRLCIWLSPSFYGFGATLDALLNGVILDCKHTDVVRCFEQQGVIVQQFFGVDGLSFEIGAVVMMVFATVAYAFLTRPWFIRSAIERKQV